MARFFFEGGNRKGILLIHLLPHGETINADACCAVLKRLQRAIQYCRQGLLASGACLLHDSEWPHTRENTTNFWRNMIRKGFIIPLLHS
jgi:hypothetical protein